MKATLPAVALLSIVLMFYSCANGFRLEKRHYRHGFYFHKKANPGVPAGRKTATRNQYHIATPFANEPRPGEHQAHQYVLASKPSQKLPLAKSASLRGRKAGQSVKVSDFRPRLETPCDHAEKIRERSPAETAKLKSRIYFLIALGLVILTFSGLIEVFVLLTIPAALFFFILALVNLVRKKRYRELEKHPEKAKPPISPEIKTKRARAWFYALLALSILLLLAGFINPIILYLFFIALIPTLIMFFKWRNRYIDQNEKAQENNTQGKKKQMNDPVIGNARKFAWLAFFWLILLIAAITAAFTGFVVSSIEKSDSSLLLMLGGITFWILSAIYFGKTGAQAYEAGIKIKSQHPGERFYRHKGTGGFARFMGRLSKAAFFVCLFVLALLVLIGLSLL